jgi:putative ABC transport system permease protein
VLPAGLLRAGLRDLLRRPLQLVLMVLGIALGVGVIIAIDLANQSARRAFGMSTEALVGQATHQIRGGPSGIPEDFYQDLRLELQFQQSAPIVEGLATTVDFDGSPLRILGVDPFAEAPFRNTLRGALASEWELESFFLQSDALIISDVLASRFGLDPGSELRLQVNGRIVSFMVLGIFDPGDQRSRQGLEDVVLLDIAAAQEVLGMEGRITRIDLIASPEQAQALDTFLPPGLQIQPASEQQSTLEQLTEAFELNLQALSLLGLVVGMFLIYNATMFTVLQRRHILGIFRTLGATNRQIFTMILLEAGIIGIFGSFVGIAIGWILGRGAVQLVSQTINDLYYVLNVRTISIQGSTLLKGVGGGILASLVAAAGPAWEASRVPEVVALQRSELERRARKWIPALGLAGVTLALLGTSILVLIRTSLVASFLGLFLILIGLALGVPISTILFARMVHLLLDRWIGPIGRMAIGTIVRSMSRTSVAVAALMVSLSVAIGVGVMISSFRSTVENWLDLTLQADIYISAPTYGGARPNASLNPALAQDLSAVAGVSEIETVRTVLVPSDEGEILLLVVDTGRARAAELYRYAAGSPRDVWDRVQAGSLIVSEPYAYRNQIPRSGGSLALDTDQGMQEFDIVGVYYDYSSERGTVLMSRSTYDEFFDDPSISSIALHVESGANLDQIVEDVRMNLRGSGLQVQVNRSLREQALEIFDRTFLITSALRILAVVVAFIGVFSAMMALQMERAREFATMQALGLREGGLWLLTSLETGIMGIVAGILSMPTGAILAVVLIYVINLRSFGWTIEMTLEPQIFLGAVVTAVVAALLAGIYPAMRLIRQPVAESLSAE